MSMNFYASYMMKCKNKFFSLAAFAIILYGFFSCRQNFNGELYPTAINRPSGKVQWNVLVYLAADNELETFAINNLLEMRTVGSDDNMNILVLFDRSPGFDSRFGNWQGTKLFRIRKGDENFLEDEICDFGELDMKSAESLDLFLRFTEQHFPSEHTMLSLWSHGFGIYPEGSIMRPSQNNRSLISDYTSDFKMETSMSIQSLANVLGNYNIDILHFDACNMAMTEIVWELASCTKYIISSQLAVPSSGMNYELLLMRLHLNPSMAPENLAESFPPAYFEKYKDTSYKYSLSCVSTSFFEKFMNEFMLLCNALGMLTEEELLQIIQIRASQKIIVPDYEEYIDLYEFFDACSKSDKLPNTLRQIFSTCKIYFQEAIVYVNDSVTSENLHGLSINFPSTNEQLSRYSDSSFQDLKMYQASSFDNFIINCLLKNPSI